MTYLEPKLCELLTDQYEGELDDSNNYSGKGELKMLDGSSYDGQFLDGLMHGQGTYNWPDGVSFTGDFFQGTISGSGKYSWPDGSSYTGQVKSGKRHGEGVFMCSAGQIYDGEWQDGHRHGKGVASYYEGKSTTVYSGEWFKDLRQGYGKMRYASGNQYEGYWYADKKCGKGVMAWSEDQSTYVGAWDDDLPNGSGEILWSNLKISKLVTKQMSSVYRGTMKNGEKSGDGSFIYADGSQYSGQWDKGVKHGDGVVIHGNGRIEATQFNEGRMMNESKTPTPSKNKTSPHKHNSPSSSVSASGSKEMKLNISDLIQTLPRADASSQDERTNLPPVYVDSKSLAGLGQDLERIMLRYQAILRRVYHSLTSSSKLDSRKESLDNLIRSSEPALSAIDQAITGSVVKHQAYLCLSLNRFKTYAREVGILGPQYTSKDLTATYQQMIAFRFQAAGDTYLKQHGKGDSDIATPTLHTVVGDNIGPTSVSEQGKDFELPLSELDFVNLLVRASVESNMRTGIVEAAALSSKTGVEAVRAPMSLPEVLRLALDSVQRHWEAKHEVAPAQLALLSPVTQNCLRKEKKAFFRGLWEKLSAGKSTVALSMVMQFLEGLQKSGAVDASVGFFEIMDIARGIVRPELVTEVADPSRPPTATADAAAGEAAGGEEAAAVAPEEEATPAEGDAAPEGEEGAEENKEEALVPPKPSLAPMDALTSLSTLSKHVDYEDFLELLCMVVMSEAWVYEDPAVKIKQEEEAAAAAAASAGGGEGEGDVAAVADADADANAPAEEAKEDAVKDAAPAEEGPPKELPEVLSERLVTFSSCFDLAAL